MHGALFKEGYIQSVSKHQRRNLMKKEVNKIVLFIGFLTAIAGIWISAFSAGNFGGMDITVIALVLALAFVNASANVLKIIGYSLNVLLGAIGLSALIKMPRMDIGTIVIAIGLLIMTLATVIYFFVFLLGYFGFVKQKGKKASEAPSLWNELNRYKEMQEDGILTDDEFSDLKQKAMDGADASVPTMDDLKKWKKLLDQQVITAEEFASIKKNIFSNK